MITKLPSRTSYDYSPKGSPHIVCEFELETGTDDKLFVTVIGVHVCGVCISTWMKQHFDWFELENQILAEYRKTIRQPFVALS